MYPSENNINSCDKKHLLLFNSKEEFLNEFKLCDKISANNLYLQLLIKLYESMLENDISNFKNLCNLIEYVHVSKVKSDTVLNDFLESSDNPIKMTNLVILACKYNKNEILDYMFRCESKILDCLSINGKKIKPTDSDKTNYNAFYYAIHSGNVDLVDTLIRKWPGNYFAVHPGELNLILSRSYDELQIKNISLPMEMEVFIQSKIVDLRFSSTQNQHTKDNMNFKELIELLIRTINLLQIEYINGCNVGVKFIFMLKFIAKIIHVLKLQLKSTYDRLPWEEIEFFLASFIFSQEKIDEINLFYRTILNANKLLNYLKNFAKKLENEKRTLNDKNASCLTKLPKLRRDNIILKIIDRNHEFEELYSDYKQIRDVCSLTKIINYLKLALSVNPKDREGQLIITRAILVIGENLKNTLESPKLSTIISELLLLLLPEVIRDVVIDFHGSESNSIFLFKRIEFEESRNVKFFIDFQNDIKKFYSEVCDMLYNSKVKIVRILLEKIVNNNKLEEIEEVAEIFRSAKLSNLIPCKPFISEHFKLKLSIINLVECLDKRKGYENELIGQIIGLIDLEGNVSENVIVDHVTDFSALNNLILDLSFDKIDHNTVNVLKFRAQKVVNNMPPPTKLDRLKEIVVQLCKVYDIIKWNLIGDELVNVNNIICNVLYIVELRTADIKWIEDLIVKFNESGFFFAKRNKRKTCSVAQEKCDNQLMLKLTELEGILKKEEINDKLLKRHPFYKINKKLQTVIEMIVLDVLLILDAKKNCLNNNLHFLLDKNPLLLGKGMLNYLLYGDILVEVLLSDPLLAVILNANKLITIENIMKCKIGMTVIDGPSVLKNEYNKFIITIIEQERMFVALEEGNMEELKDTLEKGASMKAVSSNSWTALHFAAKGCSVDIIQFLVNHKLEVNVKDINGQNPMHIAAANGRENIIDLLVKIGVNVNEQDNYGQSALHIAAANGHTDTMKVLLQNNASTTVQNIHGISPLYYAIKNNHIDVVKVLLDVNTNVDEVMGDSTLLHKAAESGYLELVNMLLKNKASLYLINDRHWTALHAAAYYNHLNVVRTLITRGAIVNSSTINGYTALHYAVKNGNEEMVNVLLEYGADVNAVEMFSNSALHIAATNGYEDILKTLLKHKANARINNRKNITPLHLAAKKGHLGITIELLKHCVNIHAKNKKNTTPFYYAVESGRKEVVEFLIKNRAEINAKCDYNLTALHAAALKEHEGIVDLLLKHGAGVNNQDSSGSTPLHVAAINGNKDIIALLIKNKAAVNAKNNNGHTALTNAALNGHVEATDFLIKNNADVNSTGFITPLHAAVLQGSVDIVNMLIKNGAKINKKSFDDVTPLHLAIAGGYKEITEILIANRADVNILSNGTTPLLAAIDFNKTQIVEVLIASSIHVDGKAGEPLLTAVKAGREDIVKILLRNKASIDLRTLENITLLHVAAESGHKEIVTSLLKRGANVNAVSADGTTPLYAAAQEGNVEVAEILIANKAKVNVANYECTPLHIATQEGYYNFVQLLLNKGANVNIKDIDNRTPLELAILFGHLEIVKMLLNYKKINVNSKVSNGFTLLHIAAQEGHLDMVKYFVSEGANINAKNTSDSKPIHIAAREGFKETVEFFLSKGMSINELGTANQTLLHYAVMRGHSEVVKYLIAGGAEVNIEDKNGITPLHLAARFGHKELIELLLGHGAFYDTYDKSYRRPLDLSISENVTNLLTATEKLFKAVKSNDLLEIENHIKRGAFVNQKNANNVSSLHYAAWKGYTKVVSILLQNKADPNIVGKKGVTPLHYAAKFSHLNIVVMLLSYGAIYNIGTERGQTPLDYTEDENIASIFKLLNESFKNVKNGCCKVINDLNVIKDVDMIRAIMNACNREKKSLLVVAMQTHFTEIEQLKQILQDDVLEQVNIASVLHDQGNHQEALNIYKSVFERRKEILGPDNPGTLDVQVLMAKVLYKHEAYQEAFNLFKDIFQKQKETLGVKDSNTLNTINALISVLHRQGKNEDAFNMYNNVYEKGMEIFGSNDLDSLVNVFDVAKVLEMQNMYGEALQINKEILEKIYQMLIRNDQFILSVQCNIAKLLDLKGEYEEAVTIYKEAFEKKKIILGTHHASTLKTQLDIALTLLNQKKYRSALKAVEEVLGPLKERSGLDHPDTLIAQYSKARALFAQCEWIGALEIYRQIYDKMEAAFGPNHPTVLDCDSKLEIITTTFMLDKMSMSEFTWVLQKAAAITILLQIILAYVLFKNYY